MPSVTGLFVYPIKSCRGIAVTEAQAGPRGFDGDRRYMVVDAKGRFVTQRQFPRMALIETEAAPGGWRVTAPGHSPLELPRTLTAGSAGASLCTVTVWRQQLEATLAGPDINVWFSSVLGFACGLVFMADDQHRPVANEAAMFDDEVSFADGAPYLLISDASLEGLNTRVADPVPMRSFRPNITVSADRPHAEDGWKLLAIGSARFEVAWPCSRCIMTTVDPATGLRRDDGEPMRTLRSYRERARAVYFGQNLLLRRAGKVSIDDSVEHMQD